ncbi:MAG: hypothetical protein AB7P76_12475 [Candidatus Melainabacteria bacterium]
MANQEAVEGAIQAWQPYYEELLTQADGEEILVNWGAYIELLSEWVEPYLASQKQGADDEE